jgi:hypothetical protein
MFLFVVQNLNTHFWMELSSCLAKMNVLVKKNIFFGESQAKQLQLLSISEGLSSCWHEKKGQRECFYRNPVHAPITPNDMPFVVKSKQDFEKTARKICRQWQKFFWSDANGVATPLVVHYASVSQVCTCIVVGTSVTCCDRDS